MVSVITFVACNIFSYSSIPFAKALPLGKYSFQYFLYCRFGFFKTDDFTWINKAYFDPVALSDAYFIQRDIRFSAVTKAIILPFSEIRVKFIPYSAGYSISVRLERGAGVDFHFTDKYPSNLLAQGLSI
jgi:hypothetical protein